MQMAAMLAEKETDPAVIAARAAHANDGEACARVEADRPYQHRRLAAAGFVCRLDGVDGAGTWDHVKRGIRIIHSVMREQDGQLWGHTSVSRRDEFMPTWEQVRDAHRLLYPDLAGVVVIPPADEHVNLSEVAHAWTCLTARPVPDFTQGLGLI